MVKRIFLWCKLDWKRNSLCATGWINEKFFAN